MGKIVNLEASVPPHEYDTSEGPLPEPFQYGEISASSSTYQASRQVSRVPRREFVWTTEPDHLSLEAVSKRFGDFLAVLPSGPSTTPLHRFRVQDGLRTPPHRCRDYVREEITFTPNVARSAVVSYTVPSPRERCSMCGELIPESEGPGPVPTITITIHSEGTDSPRLTSTEALFSGPFLYDNVSRDENPPADRSIAVDGSTVADQNNTGQLLNFQEGSATRLTLSNELHNYVLSKGDFGKTHSPFLSLPPSPIMHNYVLSKGDFGETHFPILSRPPSPSMHSLGNHYSNYDHNSNPRRSYSPSPYPRVDEINPRQSSLVKTNVASEAIVTASQSRRKKEARFACPIPGCFATFTTNHNLKSTRSIFGFSPHRLTVLQ